MRINTKAIRTAPSALRATRSTRAYHSEETPDPHPYSPLQRTLLSSGLTHVPSTGFTISSLRAGLADNAHPASALNLFPHGAFSLVLYHLRNQRLLLRDTVQFPSTSSVPVPVGAKVKSLVLARLEGNVAAGVVGRYTEALALMSLAENIPASVRELGLLSDEMWYLAGDKSVDGSWYSKRATLGAVYAAAEVFQTQDQSTEYKDTREFVGRRLEEVRVLGGAVRNVGEWMGFQGTAAVNLARSMGMRI
ncbi:Ubiquinone biosynthesis protein coq9, mitochondrial [Sphaceloma murrayae]|uniref:Ubiquinone biosynthesis protein n=1 Tax=Sphaceloma murrayae TaxID=2082308 RepID=A0A2K1QRY2_9PEZI|nr:Ubiquinone biosynthesis protein coq9, mitochondrial [Sphaceloma murrayae]